MSGTILNIAGYKFVNIALEKLPALQATLKSTAQAYAIRGTILLGTEGINAFVAGNREAITGYQTFLRSYPEFQDLSFRESLSKTIPFARLLVRIKKEIIAMGNSAVNPMQATAPYIEPETLEKWYNEKKDFVILDTRNDYEAAIGTFDNALDLNLESFREFPDAISMLPKETKDKPVVTFCTGGIRCEKAAALMQQKGFNKVYQLKGGILNYFEKVGGKHYHGDCFIFDKRLTVDSNLKETDTVTCYAHRQQIMPECPHCQHIRQSRQAEA